MSKRLSLLLTGALLSACGQAPTVVGAGPQGFEPAVQDVSAGEPAKSTLAEGRAETPYGIALRANAQGEAIQGFGNGGPVYLSPRHYPVIFPGSPAPLPHFTPRPLDDSLLPVDAFEALALAGRLREGRPGAMPWLFGQTFPKITALKARTLLGGGQVIFVAPDGSILHRDKAYQSVTRAEDIEAMLPELRRLAREKLAQAARKADIAGRAAVLPAFNGTYDIWKLLLLEAVVTGFTFEGKPVRRGVVTTALLYERDDVRREIATYWQDHPEIAVHELRQVTNRVLGDRLRALARRADTLAEDPAGWYDAQLIPGLRDPRPITGADRRAHDEDVAYNVGVIRQLGNAMPLMLGSTLYP